MPPRISSLSLKCLPGQTVQNPQNLIVIERKFGHKLHSDRQAIVRTHQCSLTLTELLADEGFEVAWRFSRVGASEDRQVAEDTCEHYPGVTVPLGVHKLSLVGCPWNVPPAFESILAVNQQVSQDDNCG